ncbi:hypothetical protein QZH41_014574 [Actinostola sp. cb2023]|nr:hypothetical protein QZH41_014574 [Actinostola sp. cb2023]
MNSLKTRLIQYLKDLYSKQRKAATYLLVFMIADELRNAKPYAIPVRFIPYHSITDSKMRDLEDELERAITSIGITVVGVSTDGEFNSLRTCGKKRPISVLEIIKNSKEEARKTKSSVVSGYFKLDQFGNIAM